MELEINGLVEIKKRKKERTKRKKDVLYFLS